MLPAAASEEKEELGTPQTPAGGLRPPALPAQQVHNSCQISGHKPGVLPGIVASRP